MPIKYDKRRYRSRSRIEIMFGRLKDWRRVATRYTLDALRSSTPPSRSPPPSSSLTTSPDPNVSLNAVPVRSTFTDIESKSIEDPHYAVKSYALSTACMDCDQPHAS